MREFNCDGLKNLTVPDELIDKALSVPAAVSAAKATVLPLRRMIAAAAVFFVGLVSVSVYFLFRNIDTAPLVAAPAPRASEQPTDESEPQTEPLTDIPTEAVVTDPIEPDSSTPPTGVPTVPTEAASIAPPLNFPAVAPIQPVPTVPAVIPTAPPAEPPTTPAMQPSEEPTEPPDPPSPPEGTEPIVPQTGKEIASVGYMVPLSSYTGSDDLYCRLYSSSGRLIGSDDLYDESRRVYFTTGSGYLFLSYPLSAIVDPLPPDNYTIVFYDADGNDFYICSAFLSRR